MSFVANKIVQYVDEDGNPVDVTELTPLPTEEINELGTALGLILDELKMIRVHLNLLTEFER